MDKRNDGKPLQSELFKKRIPTMQEGYYSGDRPNEYVFTFVSEHRALFENQTNFTPQPYLKTIKASKANPVYNMHSYSSKKPFDAVERYIKNFSKPGELVLDPFCGSGGTIYCCLKNGRKTIGIDLSPAATFITKGLCTPYDPRQFHAAAESLVHQIETLYRQMFITTCGHCLGKAEIRTVAWSMVFRCAKCLKLTPLAEAGSDVEVEAGTAKGRCICGQELRIKDKINRWDPVRIEYVCLNGCGNRAVSRRSLASPSEREKHLFAKDREAILEWEDKLKVPGPSFPEFQFPERARVQVLQPRGIKRHSQVYSNRNRAIVEHLWALIEDSSADIKECLRFWFTASILSLTLFERDREGGGGYQSGTMYIPYNCKDRAPFGTLRSKIGHITKGLDSLQNLSTTDVCISTQDASSLYQIPTNSVDYIFTDPPYGDKVQYWELNCIWEAWLGFNREYATQEAVINYSRGLDEKHWQKVIRRCFMEMFRVLRPGRYLSVCFHGSDIHWTILQDICCEIGFVPDQAEEATAIDSVQKSFKQLREREANVRRDLVVNFRKPLLGEINDAILITGEEDTQTFKEKACSVIYDYLSRNPGSARERIYDEMISRMLRSGLLEAHDFDELLGCVAEPIEGDFGTIWYLKDIDLTLIDVAESSREESAVKKISEFLALHLKANPSQEGVHYSEIFEHYVYAVKDKPRHPLAEWLLDYFFKTDLGTYRLPASEEEERLKAEGRKKGTIRRIKRYLAFLEQGVAIPEKERQNDATLAEWIRHCKRTGLYDQGKLLYEKGGINLDALPEELMVSVEEDYQVCARMLARGDGGGAKGTGRGRKKAEVK